MDESDSDNVYATTGSGGRPALKVAKVEGKSNILEFNLEDLLKAPAEVLFRGVFGTTFKAVLESGTTMVVKRMKDFDMSEDKLKFGERIEAIEKISHENLMPLRASYNSKHEKLLVLEYMPMGSLFALLHGYRDASRTPLNLDTRIKIALGAARGIAHLHSLGPLTTHGSIKSSNILLTSNFETRVSDYGFTPFSGPNYHVSKRVDGYLAPEVTYTREVSHKADVYSYGVLFLELLTGKDPNEPNFKDEGLDLPRWMLCAINDEWTSEVFDVELLQDGDLEEVMLQLLELAFSWTARDPDNRPSMYEVITQVETVTQIAL
ncbi:Leucine-rich repeat protein kinase family protein [Euphorbia peplus]|nr:Leucine-rich repeat protein kinase family protein [Euphorbia peplus]